MAQLINEAKRMQLLAGLITESQLNEEGMTLPIKNFLKMGEDEFKVNFVKFTNNSAGHKGFGGTRSDGSFPVSVETDIKGKGPDGKFVINAYVTKEGNLDHIFLPGYDNSETLVKQVKDWGALRNYITSELAKTKPAAEPQQESIEQAVNEALAKVRLNELDSNVQKLRDGFFKKLDAFAKAYVALANDGEDNGLFKVDKGAEQKWDAFSDAFDVAYKQWGPLYQYIKGTTAPALSGFPSSKTAPPKAATPPGVPPRAAAPPPPSGPKNAPPRRPIPPPPPSGK
jgi:hypothetical protein